METPNIRGLGIVQDSFTMRWKASGYVEGMGWLEAWELTLIEAMEALQGRVAEVAMEKDTEEGDS